MSKNTEFPKFHSKGSPRGDFYSLAFVKGLYVPPSEKTKDDSFLILNYSPSKDFTRFSFAIDSADGRLHAYKRGNDTHDSIETALITAWYEYEVPPHLWALFPKSEVNRAKFGNKQKHPKQYWDARKQFCSLLYHFRLAAWFKTQECATKLQFKHPLKPLFRFKTIPRVSDPIKPNPENEEILQAVVSVTSQQA
jgi:hypothetical protein